MSAYKTAIVRLGESEYNRLRAAEEQLRLMELSQGERNRQREQAFQRTEKLLRNESNTRIEQVDQITFKLGRNLHQMQSDVRHDLQEQNSIFMQELRFAQDSDQQQTRHAVEQANVRISDAIEHQNHQFAQIFEWQETFHQQVSNLRQKNMIQAKILLDTNAAWIDWFQSLYPPQVPGMEELMDIELQLTLTAQTFDQGLFEACLASAQSIYLKLSKLNLQIEAACLQNQTLYQLAIERFAELEERAESERIVPAMDQNGNELSDQIDVDQWTRGAYVDFLSSIHQQEYFLQNSTYIQLEDLQTILDQDLPLLNRHQLDLVTHARFEVISSQIRLNVAQIILEALEDQGFAPKELIHPVSDYLGAYELCTRNANGSEVVVLVEPSETHENGRICIASSDADRITEHELLQRNREILTSLTKYGIPVENIRSSLGPDFPAESGLVAPARLKKRSVLSGG